MIPLLIFVAQAAPSTAEPQPNPFGSVLFMFLPIVVIFYFLIIRPQKKRQQDQMKLMSELKTGDKVITEGGVHGLISNVKESTVMLKIADNVKIEIEKSKIDRIVKRPEAEPAAS